MTTATPSTALATIQPAFTDPERLALAGFLTGFRSLTRGAYALDLRQFTSWCRTRKGRQGGDRPAGAAHGPGNRPGRQGTDRWPGVPGCRRATAGPARRRTHRPQDRQPRRDRQDRHAPHAAAHVHHRRVSTLGSRCATSKKPPLMQIREPQCGMTGPAAASTGMRPTSSPPTSRVPPGNGTPTGAASPGSGSGRAKLPM
jgi:hypothetical protein